MKRKIIVTTGTRSEFGLLRSVLEEISKSKKLELFLIVAGMHLSKKYGNTINEITKEGFKIHGKVAMVPKNDTNYDMAVSLGEGIVGFSKLFKKIKPDLNLVLGDRDEAFASSLAAYHMNIPNAHIHGGDKTQAGIDEYTRHAITKISNIHFAVTQKSKKRIIQMGENPKYVFFTGSPSVDDIAQNKITSKFLLEKKYKLKFSGNEIILLYHPVTTEHTESGKEFENIMKAILKLKTHTICISPNSDVGNSTIFQCIKKYSKYNFIHTFDSIPRSDYLGLLKNCKILLGNSSSGMIEGSYFPINVINIGIRQKNRESGKNVINMYHPSSNLIYSKIKKILESKNNKNFQNKFIYGKGGTAKKITKTLENIPFTKNLIQKQINY
jgi:GDP/UDP-N,N'-diacetylbacillosamine 2-epimerase (hydrolysing)